MICPPCRKQEHDACPEKARQAAGTPLPGDLLGGSLCDCQHLPYDRGGLLPHGPSAAINASGEPERVVP